MLLEDLVVLVFIGAEIAAFGISLRWLYPPLARKSPPSRGDGPVTATDGGLSQSF